VTTLIAIASRVSNGVLYGMDTPYGHPASGFESSIAALTRGQLVTQHQQLILHETARPSFCPVMSTPKCTARQIEAALAGLQAGGQTAASDASIAGRHPTTIYLVDKPGAAKP